MNNFRRAITALVATALVLAAAGVAGAPLYLVQSNGGSDTLLTFEGGVLSTVGSIGFGDVRGLAYDATTDSLFGVSRTSDRLIRIDTTTGAGTAVSSNNYISPTGSNTAEMSFDASGNLYGMGHTGSFTVVDTLFSVNTTTGVAASIGSLGIPGVGLAGLGFDYASGTLYGTTFQGQLYSVNTGTGAATHLGLITGTNGTVARIAFDQETGDLFGITSANQLVEVNLQTLVGTAVAQFASSPQIYSLDFGRTVSPIPEPETYAMLLAGLSLLGFAARRRKLKLVAV